MAKVAFKKGLLANLPAAIAEGTFYITTDERALYLDVDGTTRVRIGDFQEFTTLTALQANTNPSTTALYYVTELNCLAKWDGTKYVQINLDTGATSVEVTGDGNALDGVTYDPATRNSAALTAEVTVTRPGDGAITASSSNTGVATVSVSGNKVTIKHVNQTTGTATITIKVAAGTNHTAPADKTVAVTAQFMPTKKALNDQTWAEIRQVSDAGQGSSYWSVGDRKAVLVNGTVGTLAVNQTLYVYILGFNHNSAKEGNGIQFGTFKTALSGGTDENTSAEGEGIKFAAAKAAGFAQTDDGVEESPAI